MIGSRPSGNPFSLPDFTFLQLHDLFLLTNLSAERSCLSVHPCHPVSRAAESSVFRVRVVQVQNIFWPLLSLRVPVVGWGSVQGAWEICILKVGFPQHHSFKHHVLSETGEGRRRQHGLQWATGAPLASIWGPVSRAEYCKTKTEQKQQPDKGAVLTVCIIRLQDPTPPRLLSDHKILFNTIQLTKGSSLIYSTLTIFQLGEKPMKRDMIIRIILKSW